ncbi:YceI family protein [Fulvivirga sediminis]|uniref:YceI family protein n=1 Tax=Fulvivirga sediminis TaxID=2803949 RepID=A0A937F7H0_9BACT|nr:YceI family protein [Fulvivirga sediminis]MBL3655684.1 YceI family protein [Fulvivirga sediminis]
MKKNSFFILLLSAGILASCGQKKEGTDAEVSEAKEVEQVEASKEYAVNADESTVTWIGSKPTGKHDGTIPISQGSIAVNGDEIVGGTITLDIANIKNTDIADDDEMRGKLEGHLKSADFFDAENHPTAEFVITSVEPYTAGDSVEVKEEFDSEYKPASADEFMVESPSHKITGNLTMRGKTLSISFPAVVKVAESGLSAKAKFNIDRTLWGLTYSAEADAVDKAKDKFIYDTVNVGFDIKASEAPAM